MRGFALLLLLVVPAFLLNVSVGLGEESSGAKRPLDLPAGKAKAEMEDENLPETILFYGQELEGDAFFWCFPAYSFCGDTDVFYSITDEVTRSMNMLSSKAYFDLVAYNTQTFVWQRKAKRATSSNKAAAKGWMSTLTTAESECLLDAGLETIRICNSTRSQKKVMIFMGGNAPACSGGGGGGGSYSEQCLNELTAANTKRVPINTVYVAAVYTTGQSFWMELAEANNGTFREVD